MRLRRAAGAVLILVAAIGSMIVKEETERLEIPEPAVTSAASHSTKQYLNESPEQEYVKVYPKPATETGEVVPTETPVREELDRSMESAFVLTICGSRIAVGSETSEEALKKRPGWLDTSAHPGETGVCVVYGHRNRRHLRVLEKVELGEEITVTVEEGSVFHYIVTEIDVADDLSEIVIPSVAEPALMLVTCYPFHYSGNAPQKYVVVAKGIEER